MNGTYNRVLVNSCYCSVLDFFSFEKTVNIESIEYLSSNVETFIDTFTKFKKNKQKIVNIKDMKYLCSNVEANFVFVHGPNYN